MKKMKKTNGTLIYSFLIMSVLIITFNGCKKEEPIPNEQFIGNWLGTASVHKKDINNIDSYYNLTNQIVSISNTSNDNEIFILWNDDHLYYTTGVVAGNVINFNGTGNGKDISGTAELTGSQMKIHRSDIQDTLWNERVYYWYEYDVHK